MNRLACLVTLLAGTLGPGCFLIADDITDPEDPTGWGSTGGFADSAEGTTSVPDDGVLDESSGGDTLTCSAAFALAGVVDGVDANFTGYTVDTTFYNTSLEEVVLDSIDFDVMQAMGLNPDDPEDQDRYTYAIRGFDFRNLYTEYIDDGGLLAATGRDVSIAFYDLADTEVQPNTPIDVFDMSPLEAVRNGGDPDALAGVLRQLIDEMRSNGKPDIVVTYAPDRSQENLGEQLFIAMLSPNARFGSDGTGMLGTLTNTAGEEIQMLAYPFADIATASLSISTTIDEQPFSVGSTCLPALISG